MTPASETLAYRIWALCQPRGWGMTVKDCAEELGVEWQRVNAVVRWKGWSDRFKATSNFEGVRENHRFVPGGYAYTMETISDLVGSHRHGGAE